MRANKFSAKLGFSGCGGLFLLGLFAGVSVTSSAQKYLFNRADFPAAASEGIFAPRGVATADFNGDGILDLAVVNNASIPGTIAILLGKADGTFQAAVDYPAGRQPVAISIGDFNKDNKLDLAVTNSADDTVSIILGNGDGTFRPQNAFATGGEPRGVSVGDFNKDGKLDLAVANYNDDTISILLGNGDGTFKAKADSPTGHDPYSIAIGDFNDDGKLDLAVVDSNDVNEQEGFVSILLGNGDGTFKPKVDYSAGYSPMSIVVADLNADGKPDLAIANLSGGNIAVLFGNDDGTFKSAIFSSGSEIAASVAAADMNGDGKIDLIFTDSTKSVVEVLLNPGDGNFQNALIYYYSTGSAPVSVATGDFNGDGKPDVVTKNAYGGTVSVLLNNGDGTLAQGSSLYNDGFGIPPSLVAADFNGDGALDLASTGPNPNDVGVVVTLGNGDGTFGPNSDFPTGNAPQMVLSADFNNDENADLAVVNAGSNSVSVLLGNGDGTFQNQTQNSVGANPQSAFAGDFNEDGSLDLAVVNHNDNTVSVLLGNSDGAFAPAKTFATGRNPQWVIGGDFNNDGREDLAIANLTDNTVSILLGKGDGTFGPHTDFASGPTPSSIAIGDFNRDGKLDLAVTDGTFDSSTSLSSGNQVSVLLGNGNGTFQNHVDYITASGPVSVKVGDFNRDGKQDLVVADSNSGFYPGGGVSVLLGNGDGSFQNQLIYQTGPGSLSVVASDFNNDVNLDIATVNFNNSTSVLLNTPVVAFFPGILSFGNEAVGMASKALNILVSNPSYLLLKFKGISISGADPADFAETNTCGAEILSGKNCTINVVFTPRAVGTRNATVSLTDNGLSGSQSLAITGVGVGPVATLSPTSITFITPHAIGTTSTPKDTKLSNTGNAALAISSIKTSGDFSQTNNCGTNLAAGVSCTIAVTFKPTAVNTRTGSVTIVDNATTSPQTVPLTGKGTTVELAPISVSFASEPVGTKSAATKVTLTNVGSAAVSLTSIGITGTNAGDFAQTNTCGSSVAAGKSCTISVTFKPSAKGSRSASISVVDNGGGSPQTVALAGTGT